MNEKVLFYVLLTNTLLCLTQFFFELIDSLQGKIAPKGSIIPGTNQKFLYWENFFTQTYGDFIFLPLIASAFVILLLDGQIPIWNWLVGGLIFLVACIFFIKSCTSPNHKPDWGFPKPGKISRGGWSHIPYLGMYCAIVVMVLININELNSLLLWTSLYGMAGWLVCWFLDYKAGHFDPIKTRKHGYKVNHF